MKHLLTLLLLAALLLSAAACAPKAPASDPASASSVDPAADLNAAYWAVFEKASENNVFGEKYFSVDLSNLPSPTKESLKVRFEERYAPRETELLFLTFEELKREGYIESDRGGMATGFTNGSVFSFELKSVEGGALEIGWSNWSGDLGADGASYLVEQKNGEWVVGEQTGMWVS